MNSGHAAPTQNEQSLSPPMLRAPGIFADRLPILIDCSAQLWQEICPLYCTLVRLVASMLSHMG